MSERLDKVPVHILSVELPGDATNNAAMILDFQQASSGSASVRWAGTGAAVLWYYPMTPRTSFTTSEQATRAANPLPVARGAEHLAYSGGGLEWAIQVKGLDSASTAGVWQVAIT